MQTLRRVLIFIIGIIALIYTSSWIDRSRNYENAHIVRINDQYFVKLNGKRKLMAHDLTSLFLSHTYEDSTLIPIPAIDNFTIRGNDIPVEKGKYKYTGSLSIKANILKVDLYFDNVDDKRSEPDDWNGVYNVVK